MRVEDMVLGVRYPLMTLLADSPTAEVLVVCVSVRARETEDESLQQKLIFQLSERIIS